MPSRVFRFVYRSAIGHHDVMMEVPADTLTGAVALFEERLALKPDVAESIREITWRDWREHA